MSLKFFILLFLISMGVHANSDGPSQLNLGFIPGGESSQLKLEAQILAEKLQNQLNIPVNVYISKDYNGLKDSLKAKKIDLAFFTAQTFVEAEAEVPLKVILKKTWKTPYYFSSLVTLKSSNISTLKGLNQKKIAFVDEQSTSGYLYPMVELQKKLVSLKNINFIFSGNHEASVKLLDQKKVDAIAVFADDEKAQSGAWTKFGKLKPKQYKVIWTSQPIPNDPIVIDQKFYDNFPKFSHELMFTLIEIQNEKLLGKKSEILGIGELVPATSKQYDPVREMKAILKKQSL